MSTQCGWKCHRCLAFTTWARRGGHTHLWIRKIITTNGRNDVRSWVPGNGTQTFRSFLSLHHLPGSLFSASNVACHSFQRDMCEDLSGCPCVGSSHSANHPIIDQVDLQRVDWKSLAWLEVQKQIWSYGLSWTLQKKHFCLELESRASFRTSHTTGPSSPCECKHHLLVYCSP